MKQITQILTIVYLLLSILLTMAFSGSVPSIYDFDGDRKADPAVYEYETGNWYFFLSSNWSVTNLQFGWDEARPVPGDYDGDGIGDLAVYHREDGMWHILESSTFTLSTIEFGWDGARPVAGDYDGDGKTDIAVYAQESGMWYIFKSSDYAITILEFGGVQMRPLPADYDGDGKTDIAVFSRESGIWYVFESSSLTILPIQFGWRDARPVPADYDGDGKTDFAVYYNKTGAWYIYKSSSEVLEQYMFGTAQMRPVPADYDGDGIDDLAVYERNSGTWSIFLSASKQIGELQFGSNNLSPLQCYHGGAMEGLICLAFGDSITYGTCSSSNGPETGYPVLLERRLAPAFGGHFILINAGVPGEETEEGTARFEDVLDEANPDIVLLMEGTNDEFFQRSFDQTEDNLRAMVVTALNRGASVIIATIPPVISNKYRERSQQQALIQAFNPRIYQIASDYSLPVAQVYEAITAVPGWEQLLMDQPTANHPNDAGYQVVRDAFFDAIAEGINSGLFY